MAESGTRLSLSTITDSKGRFIFLGLPASESYFLQVAKQGYAAGGITARLQSAGARISLRGDEWFSSANLTLVRLGGISGRIVDELGEPVVGVPVRVLKQVQIGGVSQYAAGPSARTDDRGVYHIEGLTPGNYLVSVPSLQATVPSGTSAAVIAGYRDDAIVTGLAIPRPAGLALDDGWLIIGRAPVPSGRGGTQVYPTVYFPGTQVLDQAVVITIDRAEPATTADFAIRPVSAVRVLGRVIGSADAVAGLAVRLFAAGTQGFGRGGEQASALTASDGTFVFHGVPSGEYELIASSSSTGFVMSGFDLPFAPGVQTGGWLQTIPAAGEDISMVSQSGALPYRSVPVHVSVGSTDLVSISIPLDPGAVIRGRLLMDDRSPLPRSVRISAEPATGDPLLAGRFSQIETDSATEARYAIDGLLPGAYCLRVFGGNELSLKSIGNNGELVDRPFEVRAGDGPSDLLITLTKGSARLSGTVRDEDGKTPKDAAIILFPVDPVGWVRYGLDPLTIRSAASFSGQTFHMNRLVSGSYYVIAVAVSLRDQWRNPKFLAAAAPLATRVDLTWGEVATRNLTFRNVTVR